MQLDPCAGDALRIRRRSRSGILATAFLALLVTGSCRRESPAALEPALTTQLQAMRDGLSAYAKAKARYPQSLEEMVAAGVMKEIPTDPVTKSKSTWKLVREESVAVNEFSTDVTASPEDAPIVDVRSGAGGSDSRGVPWSEY